MDEPYEWPVFAGVDWGGSQHQLCVVDHRGQRLTQLKVSHDVAGLRDLDAELHRHGDRLPIAVERSEGLLVEHLQAGGHVVFPVWPRIAARARERYRSPRSRTTGLTRSCWPTACGTSMRTGGRWQSRPRCWRRSRR
jgi:hypothetical protein